LNTNFDFFLVLQAAFVRDALTELQTKFPNITQNYLIETSKAGIEIKNLPMLDGLELNHHLKIPTRILLRLTSFKCRDFPKLFQKTSKLEDLRHFLREEAPCLHVTTQESRLNHSDRIKDTMMKALAKLQIAYPPSPHLEGRTASPDIYVRFYQDQAQVSVDTSGEPLYKRGLKNFVSLAPLRENLAASLLARLSSASPQPITQITQLIDPMCGMGTFLFEATNWDRRIDSNSRSFIYENFPIMKKKKISIQTGHSSYFANCSCFGIEQDLATFNSLAELKEKSFQVLLGDYKKVGSQIEAIENSACKAIISNPPYGKRIKIEGPKKTYYSDLLQSYIEVFSPHLVGVIIPGRPEDSLIKHLMALPLKLKFKELVPFQNGGINCCFMIFTES
jgi:putative N6-adenine-specific DNA methylase